MKQFAVEKVPVWALPYIINDDPTGLGDNEIEQVDEWMRAFPGPIVVWPKFDKEGNFDSPPYFEPCPAFGLACDVVDCNIILLT